MQNPLIYSTSKASAPTPPASLSRLAPGGSAEASAAAPAAGTDAVAEQEQIHSERAVELNAFLRDWRLELAPKLVEHSWNPDWPESRVAINVKYQKQVVIGLVYQALWSLGNKIDRDVWAAYLLECTSKPTVAFYASRHRASELNQERKVGRGAGGGGKEGDPKQGGRPEPENDANRAARLE